MPGLFLQVPFLRPLLDTRLGMLLFEGALPAGVLAAVRTPAAVVGNSRLARGLGGGRAQGVPSDERE